MQDAWRAYLELALGLTEAPRKRAQEVVRRMVGSGGATAAQVQAMAEELVSTGLANRDALTRIVRAEVDRAFGLIGLATADEVAELQRRVRDLEQRLREAQDAASAAGAARPAGPAAEPTAPSRRPAVKKTVAKKAVVGKTVVKKTATAPATPASRRSAAPEGTE